MGRKIRKKAKATKRENMREGKQREKEERKKRNKRKRKEEEEKKMMRGERG